MEVFNNKFRFLTIVISIYALLIAIQIHHVLAKHNNECKVKEEKKNVSAITAVTSDSSDDNLMNSDDDGSGDLEDKGESKTSGNDIEESVGDESIDDSIDGTAVEDNGGNNNTEVLAESVKDDNKIEAEYGVNDNNEKVEEDVGLGNKTIVNAKSEAQVPQITTSQPLESEAESEEQGPHPKLCNPSSNIRPPGNRWTQFFYRPFRKCPPPTTTTTEPPPHYFMSFDPNRVPDHEHVPTNRKPDRRLQKGRDEYSTQPTYKGGDWKGPSFERTTDQGWNPEDVTARSQPPPVDIERGWADRGNERGWRYPNKGKSEGGDYYRSQGEEFGTPPPDGHNGRPPSFYLSPTPFPSDTDGLFDRWRNGG